jgi:hypothetical protein
MASALGWPELVFWTDFAGRTDTDRRLLLPLVWPCQIGVMDG